MRSLSVLLLGSALVPMPVTAQDNPFALTGGSVKSAHIVYQVTSKDAQAQAASYEVGLTGERYIMRMVTPFEMAGKKDTVRFVVVSTRDSQYTYSSMGGQSEGQVSPLLRPHLARAYAALDAAAKARFRENVKLATANAGSSDADAYITLIGDKAGSETIAGHKCEVYKTRSSSACVIPRAPMVMLRWQESKQGLNLIAKRVALNGPVPPALAVLPKGVKWVKKGPDDADFINKVWSLKKQTDPEQVSPATLTRFAVGYLASPQATAELREMGVGVGEQNPETGEAEDTSESEP
jgi:hypothetical protein